MTSSQDFTVDYVQQLNDAKLKTNLDFLNDMARAAPTSDSTTAPEASNGVMRDIGRGMIEIPLQTTGGILDSVNDTSNLIFDLAGWLNNKVDLGQLSRSETGGIAWKPGMPDANRLQVPSTPSAESTTGGIVREISNFVSLFLGTGKLKAFSQLTSRFKMGQVPKSMLQGFIADFVDNPETNLSRIIQAQPELGNEITAWLGCEKDCTELDKRLRTAIEGVGLGVVTEGFMRSLSLLKRAKEVKDEVVDANVLPESSLTPEAVKEALQVDLIDRQGQVTGSDVYVNWAKINTDDDIKALMGELVQSNAKQVKAAQRDVRSWETTKLSARRQEAWKLLESLNERGTGATLNAEESLALRQLWVTAGEKLDELAAHAASNPAENVQLQFQKMLNIYKAIQEKVIGVRTETARALNAWKIPAGSNLERLTEINRKLDLVGGGAVSQALAKRYIELGNNETAKSAFVRGSLWAKSAEAVRQLWYFSLLSGPHTHVRNFLSNGLTSVMDVGERRVASMIGNQVAPDEAKLKIAGMAEGMKDAFRITARSAKALLAQGLKGEKPSPDDLQELGSVFRMMSTGESSYSTGASKIDHISKGGISDFTQSAYERVAAKLPESSTMLHHGVSLMHAAAQHPAKLADRVTNLPHQMLNLADEMYKTVNYRGEIHAQAGRRARQMVENGEIKRDEVASKIADFISDPDEAMRIASNRQAEMLTFTGKPEYDSKVWQFLRSTGRLPVAGRIIMPFTRVVYNMGSYTFERTPVAPMVKRWRDDIGKGGPARDIALAKMGMGTMALVTAADLSMRGMITGQGDPDPRRDATMRRAGIQPNSVKIGNTYYSYRGMEPIASPLGISANMAEILAHYSDSDNSSLDELVIASTLAIGNQMISQQYVMGLANLFDAMSDPTRKGEAWFKNLAKAVVPAGVAHVNRAFFDSELHQIDTMLDAFRSRVPGLSASVPYRVDLWGRKINLRSEHGEIYDFLSPFYAKTYKPEPIDLELLRLSYSPSNIPLKVNFEGVMIDMEQYPRAFERYKILAGNAIKKDRYGVPIDVFEGAGLMDTLNALVQGKHPLHGNYRLLTDGPDGGKANMISGIISKFREAAKQRIRIEFPELDDEIQSRETVKYKFQESANVN